MGRGGKEHNINTVPHNYVLRTKKKEPYEELYREDLADSTETKQPMVEFPTGGKGLPCAA